MRTSTPFAALVLSLTALVAQDPALHGRPNVVLVMTDDQGYGDYGFVGNPVLRTPQLDALAAASARLANFYVSPVCTPTRAALMTGRYAQRTRAFDTYIGRAMMDPAEVTIAELLRDAGYATGIFGKWHLGDCYPLRAIDQGFEEALVLRGGGIGQPSDPPGGEGKYTDPILFRNGVAEPTHGYCTDVFFREALAWMRREHDAGRPFFCYIATNAPHGPFGDVPEELRARYRAEGLDASRFPPTPGHAAPERYDEDRLARIYAMIENIDENIGRLRSGLAAMGCAEDTLILFLADNGPEGRRWVAGYRGAKSHVHEGGIRSPLLAHWPGHLAPGVASDRIAAHIDILPTVLEACAVPVPAGLRLDGRSVLPLLERRPDAATAFDDRALVLQANRGNVPVRYHNVALRTQDWKLVNASGFDREVEAIEPRFELYDMRNDPYELHDVAAAHPDHVATLRGRYDAWFDDVAATRPDAFAPPRIAVGATAEPVTVLTRQDWRRDAALRGWGAEGTWLLDVRRAGNYRMVVRMPRGRAATSGEVHGAGASTTFAVDGATFAIPVVLPAGAVDLRVVFVDAQGPFGPHQLELSPQTPPTLPRITDDLAPLAHPTAPNALRGASIAVTVGGPDPDGLALRATSYAARLFEAAGAQVARITTPGAVDLAAAGGAELLVELRVGDGAAAAPARPADDPLGTLERALLEKLDVPTSDAVPAPTTRPTIAFEVGRGSQARAHRAPTHRLFDAVVAWHRAHHDALRRIVPAATGVAPPRAPNALWPLERPPATVDEARAVLLTWRATTAADRSQVYLEVDVDRTAGGFELHGATELPMLAEAARRALESVGVRPVGGALRLLPDPATVGDEPFGTVRTASALTWRVPGATTGHRIVDPAGQVEETELLGDEPVRVLDRREGFLLVHALSGYLGWVAEDAIARCDAATFARRLAAATHGPTLDALAQGTAVARTALSRLGTPYVFGGRTANGIDCSGLVETSWASQGVYLPRDARQQILAGVLVATARQPAALEPGDLLFFANASGRISHVGVSLGGARFVHATPPEVTVASLDPDDPWYAPVAERFVLAKRVAR